MQEKRRSPRPRPPRQLKAWLLAAIDVGLIVVCLLVFALFDHVIPRAQIKVVSALPTNAPQTAAPQATDAPPASPDDPAPAATAEPRVGDFSDVFADKFTAGEVIQTGTSYQSANLNVTLTRYEGKSGNYDEVYFVQDIYVRNIECLRTVFAKDTYGKSISEDVESMSRRVSSICAINSDYYGYGNAGIVIRNGELFRSEFEPNEEVLIIYRDGSMRVFRGESDLDVEQAMEDGAWQSFSFGPGLLDASGDIRAEGYERVNHDPRTIIGMIEPGHYLFIVVDGRQNGYSDGLTYAGCAQLAKELGCKVAYNLDGGRTSQMTFMGSMVNRPYKDGRDTSDMIYIADVSF